jgi:hypothetical protein
MKIQFEKWKRKKNKINVMSDEQKLLPSVASVTTHDAAAASVRHPQFVECHDN